MDSDGAGALTPGYLLGGIVISLIVLTVGLLGLMNPLDAVGTSASVLVALVGLGGLIDLGRRLWRSRANSR